MYLVREVFNCKPGKVRLMIEKLKVVTSEMGKAGQEPFRLMTDVSGEPFWTVVVESQAAQLEEVFEVKERLMNNEAVENAMADYHDCVVSGRREIFRLED